MAKAASKQNTSGVPIFTVTWWSDSKTIEVRTDDWQDVAFALRQAPPVPTPTVPTDLIVAEYVGDTDSVETPSGILPGVDVVASTAVAPDEAILTNGKQAVKVKSAPKAAKAPAPKATSAEQVVEMVNERPDVDVVEETKERKVALQDVSNALMAASNRGVPMSSLRSLIQNVGGVERLSGVPAEKLPALLEAFQKAGK